MMDDDDGDFAFFVLFLQAIELELEAMGIVLLAIIDDLELEQRRAWRRGRRCRERQMWSDFQDTLDDKLFRRMFRMPRESFDTLAQIIETSVGSDVFKSELYMMERKAPGTDAAIAQCGGFICGELKLALTLRMLAGASYLDLLMQYGVSPAALYQCFYETINWIESSFEFPLSACLENEDWEYFKETSELFAAASGGAFRGCIGAIDGLAVKI
jgi:hypothetical protein